MIPEIKLSEEEEAKLGSYFLAEIKAVENERREVVNRYQKWTDAYEGKVEPKDFPWENASNVTLGMPAAHTDAIFSRLMNSKFAQDVLHLWKPLAAEWVDFAAKTQKFSELIERTQIDLFSLYEQVDMVTTKMGQCIVYIPWENYPVKGKKLVDGRWVDDPHDILDRPNPRPIHPSDFLIPSEAGPGNVGIQNARWVGYYYDLDEARLRMWRAQKFISREKADKLLERFSPTPRQETHPVKKAQREAAGLATQVSRSIRCAFIQGQYQLTDGELEEITLHLDVQLGGVLRVSYPHYDHGRRPFVEFHHRLRDGMFYAIGVVEMLYPIGQTIDTLIRQQIDNHTVRNTCAWKAKKGAIKPRMKIWPGKVTYMGNLADLEPLAMSQGEPITTIQLLQALQAWGERRDGVSDFQLGQEGSGRTPATTTLARLQEATKELDLIVMANKKSMAELWMQVMELYAQFKPQITFSAPTATGKFDIVEWNFLPGPDFRARLAVFPTISTAAINKAAQKQELMGTLSELLGYNKQAVELITQLQMVQDPALRMIIISMIGGSSRLMDRILTASLGPEADGLMPPMEEILNALRSAEVPAPLATGSNEVGAPAQLPGGVGGVVQPATAPNRPAANLPRLPGGVVRVPEGS